GSRNIRDGGVPRNAPPVDPIAKPARGAAKCEPGCHVAGPMRHPGRPVVLRVADGPAIVTLPHYYFPVGWAAVMDLDGRRVPVRIGSTPDGFMQLVLLKGGRGELTFPTTPGRRRGAMVSAVALIVTFLVARFLLPRPVPLPLSGRPTGRLRRR